MTEDIKRVESMAFNVETDFTEFGIDRRRNTSICLVEIETASGILGHGITYQVDSTVLARIIDVMVAPAILSMNALETERVGQTLYWGLTGAAQTGFACHAMSAVDLALWDIKGKAAGLPIWRLLGGARDRVPVYATLGVPFLPLDELVEMACQLIARGFRAIKIQVGRPGLDQRAGASDLSAIISDDVNRLTALREALGDGVEMAIDGSCKFDLPHAVALAERAKPLGIGWYEEPILGNDPRLTSELRRITGIAVSAGQSEGSLQRFREMLVHGALDTIQPNVAVAGGITGCSKLAALAQAFNVTMASGGGGCPYHNMHIQAGFAAGTTVEYQTSTARACETLFKGYPQIESGEIVLPEIPGLGFDPDPDAIKEHRVRGD